MSKEKARAAPVNYGVTSVLVPDVSSTDEMLDLLFVEGGHVQKAQLAVFGRDSRWGVRERRT